MQAQIRQLDGRLAICFPEAIATQAHLREGMKVEIDVVNGKLTIRPVAKKYDLSDLLAAITPDNVHDAIDTGSAVGQEIW